MPRRLGAPATLLVMMVAALAACGGSSPAERAEAATRETFDESAIAYERIDCELPIANPDGVGEWLCSAAGVNYDDLYYPWCIVRVSEQAATVVDCFNLGSTPEVEAEASDEPAVPDGEYAVVGEWFTIGDPLRYAECIDTNVPGVSAILEPGNTVSICYVDANATQPWQEKPACFLTLDGETYSDNGRVWDDRVRSECGRALKAANGHRAEHPPR